LQKILNPAFDLRISIPAKKVNPAGCIDKGHLRMPAVRNALSWAEVIKVVEVPALAAKSRIRPRRVKSLSAANTAARLVRAPEIRIASSKIAMGISRVVFMHNLYDLFMDKSRLFYRSKPIPYARLKLAWVQPAGWAALT
jgi:hypothetical protein